MNTIIKKIILKKLNSENHEPIRNFKILQLNFQKYRDKDGQSNYNHPKCIFCRSCYFFVYSRHKTNAPTICSEPSIPFFKKRKKKFLLLESLLNSTSAKNVLGSFPPLFSFVKKYWKKISPFFVFSPYFIFCFTCYLPTIS